jgi:Domain of unknown function (DUF2828)
MSAHSNIVMKEGVKGSDVYESTGDPRVDLSVMLVRGLTADKVAAGMEAVLAMPLKEALEDLCVLLFQTRNIRGGKGERTLAYDMLEALDKKQHALSLALLPLFSHYGCWRDLFKLALNVSFTEAVMDLVVKQFALDNAALVTEGGKVSLLAKWAPREKSHGGPLAKLLAKRLCADSLVVSEKLKAYRKMVSALNKHIDTVEVKMCDRHFADIEPGHVPGRALQKYRRAFLNEASTWQDGKHVKRPGSGDRSTEYDRVESARHFSEHFHKGAKGDIILKGADTVYPHEVVEAVYLADGSEAERNLRLGQWLAFVAKAREGGALKNCLAMCDFSGSMDGLPKMVSLALGLLIAEVSGSNKILTFDSEPKWHTFNPDHNLYKKVASVGDIGQGLSTDFQKAMDLVLTDIKERRCRPEEVPKDLIVFTDMGWDEACSSSEQSQYTGNSYRNNVKTASWQTHIQMIRENFRRAGEDLHGVPFVPPRIVIWNLRAEYSDFHARADEEGVVMLSGWSPALFKVLQEKGIEVLTPYAALRLQLDDPMYQPVRDLVRKHVAENKGIFSYWQ